MKEIHLHCFSERELLSLNFAFFLKKGNKTFLSGVIVLHFYGKISDQQAFFLTLPKENLILLIFWMNNIEQYMIVLY